MESCMVASWSQEINTIIKEFFLDNFPEYKLVEETAHGPNWSMKYMNNDLLINIQGDVGFYINIFIDGTLFELWQYNKTVNQYAKTNSKNIKYQLSILKDFLK